MSLTKLFEKRRVLDERIVKEKGLEGQNLLDKKFVALHTELGEMMNEQRNFKFWSNDRESRTKVPVTAWGEPYKNPLLEELVDVLHFLLSIGNDMGAAKEDFSVPTIAEKTIELQHLSLVHGIAMLHHKLRLGGKPLNTYRFVFMQFVNLSGMLDFTWGQIEAAYYDKNKINHERQASNY